MDDDPNTADISLVSLPPPRNIGIRPKVFINNITARLVPLQNNGTQKRKLIKLKAVAGNLQKPSHKLPIIKFLTGDKCLNIDSQKINSKHNGSLLNDVTPPGKLYAISQPSSTINSSCSPIKLVNDSDDRLPEKKDKITRQNGTTIVVHSKKKIDTTANTIENAGSEIATSEQSKSLHLTRVITTIPNLSLIQRTNYNKIPKIKIITNSVVNSAMEDNTNKIDIIHKTDYISTDSCKLNEDNVNNELNDIPNISNENGIKQGSGNANESTVENDYEFALRLQRELDAEEKRKRLRRKSEPKPDSKIDTSITKTKSTKKESQSIKKEKKKDESNGEEINNIKKRGRKTKKDTFINKDRSDDEAKNKMSPHTENNISLKEGPKKRGRKSKKGVDNLLSNEKKVDENNIEKSSDSPASESSTEKESNVDLSLEKYPRPRTMGFEKIIKNVYRCEPDIDYRLADEVCDCRPSDPNNIQANSGCGENCISRCMNLECHGCAFGRKGCSNRRMQRRQNAPVEAFWAGIKGWGLRAKADISKGDFIMEYCGEVLNGKQENRRARRYAKDNQKHHYFMHLTSLTTIDAYYKGNISRCMNHSCDPNAQTEKWRVKGITRVGFFATKNIKKGEEICFNYHFFNYGKEPQKCYCGSAKCKGTIGEAIPNDPGVVDDDYESSSCTDTDSPSENDSEEEDEGVEVTPTDSPPDENKNVEAEEVSISVVSSKKNLKSPIKKSKIVEVVKESSSSKDDGITITKDVPKKSLEKIINKAVEDEDMSDSTLSSDDEVDESPLVVNKKEETPVEIVSLTKEELKEIEHFKEKVGVFAEIVNKEADNKCISPSTITKCCDMLNDCFSVQQSIVVTPLIKRITEIKTKETQLLENGVLKILTDHLSMNKFVDGKGYSMFNMDMLNYIEMLLDSIINILLYEKMGKYAKFIAESQLEVVLLEVYGKLVQMAKDSTFNHNSETVKLVGEIKEKVAYAKNKAKGYINEDPDAVKSTAIIEDKINRQQRKEARDNYRYSHRKQRYHDSYYRRRGYCERRRKYESRRYYNSRRNSYDRKRSPDYGCYKNKRRRENSEDNYYNDSKRIKTDYRDNSYRGESYRKRSYSNNRSPSRSYGRSRYRSKSTERKYSSDVRKYNEYRRSRSRSSDRLRHRNSRKYFESPLHDKKDYRRDYRRKISNSPRNSISRCGDSRSHHRSRSPRRDSLSIKHKKDIDKRRDDRRCDDKKNEINKKEYSFSSKSDKNKYNERKRSPSEIMSYDCVKKNKLEVEEKKNSNDKVREERISDVKSKDRRVHEDKDKKLSDDKSMDKKPSNDKDNNRRISDDKYKDNRASDDRYKDTKAYNDKFKDRKKSSDEKKISQDKVDNTKNMDEKYRDRKIPADEFKDRKMHDADFGKISGSKYKEKKSFDDRNSDRKDSEKKTKDKKTSLDRVKEKPRESSPYIPTLKKRIDEIMGFSKDQGEHSMNKDKKEEDNTEKKNLSLSDLHHQISLARSKIKAIHDGKPTRNSINTFKKV